MKKVFFSLLPALLLIGCETPPHRGYERPESRIVIPSSFLYVGNPYLGEWLEQPFELRYREATLDEVFASRPLEGMNYRFSEMPWIDDRDLLNLTSPGMSRRQLLWTIAETYDLEMHMEFDGEMPSAIHVMGNPKPAIESIEMN